jgi:hypothetical protein
VASSAGAAPQTGTPHRDGAAVARCERRRNASRVLLRRADRRKSIDGVGDLARDEVFVDAFGENPRQPQGSW